MNVEYHDFRELRDFQGKLKRRTSEQKGKLRRSIEKHGFRFPFFAWKAEDGELLIIDGHGRREVLEEMDWKQPVPVVLIDAAGGDEAKELLLQYNSRYGTITAKGLEAFIADISEFDISEYAISAQHAIDDYNAQALDETVDMAGLETRALTFTSAQYEVLERHFGKPLKTKLVEFANAI